MHERWYAFLPWAASPYADAKWGRLKNPLIANAKSTTMFRRRIFLTPFFVSTDLRRCQARW
jgi:hypothetical protein